MRANADVGGCFPTGRHYPGIAHLLRAQTRGTLKAFSADASLLELPVVAIDVEATGLDPEQDRLVEIACVVMWPGGLSGASLPAASESAQRRGVRVERHAWLINPGRPIPAEAQAVHKISDEDVKDSPTFAAIAALVAQVLDAGVPLAYNAEFDRAFIAAELRRALGSDAALPRVFAGDVTWLDPLVWARQLQKEEKSRSLGSVAERLGIEIGQAHRAADDAEAAGHVMRAFLSRGDVPVTYGTVIQEQRRLSRAQADERLYWRG